MEPELVTEFATKDEQEIIDQANLLLKKVSLEITHLKGERGTILPSKGF